MFPFRTLCRNPVFRPSCLFSQTALKCGERNANFSCLSRCSLARDSPTAATEKLKFNDYPRNLILKRQYSDTPPVRPRKRFSLVVKTLKEYGPVFLIFHTCTSILTVTVFYILVSRDFDVSVMLSFAENYINVENILSKAGYSKADILSPTSSNATSGIIALLLYKLTSPLRLILDSIMVPVLVRNLRYMGIMQPETAVDNTTLARIEQRIEEFENKYDELDLEPAVNVIRRRVAKRNERRRRQMEKYAETQRKFGKKYIETQRKIDKVFKKKKDAAEGKGIK